MNKTIVFDMDGTIADLYGVEGWLDMLRAEDATPYRQAKPIYDMDMLNDLIDILKNMGYPYLTPPQKAEYNKNEMNINKVATRTTVDGYPIALFWRRTYNDDLRRYDDLVSYLNEKGIDFERHGKKLVR